MGSFRKSVPIAFVRFLILIFQVPLQCVCPWELQGPCLQARQSQRRQETSTHQQETALVHHQISGKQVKLRLTMTSEGKRTSG